MAGMLFGREAEQARISELLGNARDGHSGVLVLRGDAGVGKSTLLGLASVEATGLTVLHACGIESETRLPYAGLHQLVRPVLNHLDRLPGPQAGALRAALGMDAGTREEWFLVSLAVLSLLAEAAEDTPLLCVVDDAHLLDDASSESLVFAARRLHAEPIAMVFAAREGEEREFAAPGLPELWMSGLDPAAAAALLDQQLGGALSGSARDRLIQSTGGNPLALMELSATLDESQLAGLAPVPLSRSIERVYWSRVEQLPEETKTVLLVAAADDSGSASLVLRAGAGLGARPDALDAAEQDDLLRVRGGQLEFRHPLIRSAVYHAAPFSRRREVHAALADALDPDADADRRAWHRAAASVDLDEGVAEELEDAARRAYRRSGFVPASLAFERAAELTPDLPHRVRLLSQAVDAAWFAGRLPRAQELIDRALLLGSEPTERAEIDRWRGLIEWSIGVPETALALLVHAAADLPDDDPVRALHLVGMACIAAAYGGSADKVADVAVLASAQDGDGSPVVSFLRTFVAGAKSYFAGGYDHAAESFRVALDLADVADAAGSELFFSVPLFAGAVGLFLGDDTAAENWNHRLATRARESGAVPAVNDVVPRLAMNWIALGRWTSAAAELAEGIRLADEIGQHQVLAHMQAVTALLAGMRGDADECRNSAARAHELASDRQLVHVENTARWALLLLELAAGNNDEAYLQARQMSHLPIAHWAGPERIEAAARAGRREDAEAWLADFGGWAEHSGTNWALSAAVRCRALLTEDSAAQLELLEEALALAAAGARPFEQARASLAYGEALRRHRQRVDARTHLRVALEIFHDLGAATWAERAREQLRASGQTARRRQTDGGPQLTEQELQVARFVAQGLSNRDVAAQLFLSPRTIDFHLRKVFAKLGITSRTQLVHVDLDPASRKVEKRAGPLLTAPRPRESPG